MFSKSLKIINLSLILLFVISTLNSCGIYRKVDAKDYPPEPEKRVRKNIEEGRGFRLLTGDGAKGGTASFATANAMWRASLDVLDFMPLLTADYGGGIIITDWYNSSEEDNSSIKISIRFLSNEIRSDAMKIQIFKKRCKVSMVCKITENVSTLNGELKFAILKKAATYEKLSPKKKYYGKTSKFGEKDKNE